MQLEMEPDIQVVFKYPFRKSGGRHSFRNRRKKNPFLGKVRRDGVHDFFCIFIITAVSNDEFYLVFETQSC
jgi:hypothetical protein